MISQTTTLAIGWGWRRKRRPRPITESSLQKKRPEKSEAFYTSRIIHPSYFFSYHSAFLAVNACHFSGRSSRAKMAVTGHTGTQAPQSMHSTGLIYSMVSALILRFIFTRMDAVNGTYVNACSVLGIHTGFGNYVSHQNLLLRGSQHGLQQNSRAQTTIPRLWSGSHFSSYFTQELTDSQPDRQRLE